MKCHVCCNTGMEGILSLPDYPLNSVYLSPSQVLQTDRYKPRGFYLYVCDACGHFQAESDVALTELYNDDYNYNTQNSGVQGRIGFFLSQLEQVAGMRFNRVIDVGCYDLSLLKAVKQKIQANAYIGIDPSIPNRCLSNEEGIVCFKDYVDNVDIPGFIENMPDLVISDQTFEHIPGVTSTLANVVKKVSADSLFAVNVPSMEVLIEKLNFHNLIHEHVNYFSTATLLGLFNRNGLSLKKYMLNYTATCGFLFGLFIKDNLKSNKQISVPNNINKEYFSAYYNIFRASLEHATHVVSCVKNEPLYGFGASDITGNLAYFMETDFSFLKSIFDDTEYKKGKFFPFLKPEITGVPEQTDFSGASCLITSPQAGRYIYNRLNTLKFKRILNPLGVVA